MLRGALIGLGNVAVNGHLPGWRARGVEIVAVTDVAARTARGGRRASAGRPAGTTPPRRFSTREPRFRRHLHAALKSRRSIARRSPRLARALREAAGLLARRARALSRARRDERARAPHRPQLAPRAHHPADGRARARGRDRPRTRSAWQTLRTEPAAGPAMRTTETGGSTRRGGRRHPQRSRLARVLPGPAVDRRAPTAVSARLERRRHTAFPVEDTATVHVTFPDAPPPRSC